MCNQSFKVSNVESIVFLVVLRRERIENNAERKKIAPNASLCKLCQTLVITINDVKSKVSRVTKKVV